MKNIFLMALVVIAGQVAFAAPETFKLYNEPKAQVNPGCDMYTELVIDLSSAKTTATLTNKLSGICEVFIEPNVRTFTGDVETDNCGRVSFYSDGELFVEGPGILVVDDYRKYTCDDETPKAVIEASEISRNLDEEVTYYSKDD